MTDHPEPIVLGYSEAAMFLRGPRAAEVIGIVSIHGAREYDVESAVRERLDLEFDDVEVPDGSDQMAMLRTSSRKRWAEQNGLREVAPNPSHAAKLIEFAGQMLGKKGLLLCHCGAGMSRATAAAIICLCVWHAPGAESDCVAEVFSLRRGAVPHAGLIRFADDLLNREGRLIRALALARSSH